MATRTKTVNAYKGVSVRGRDAGQLSAPIRVSDEARSRKANVARVQQFGFPGPDRNVLSDRPNTSGGPSPHFSARKEAEGRRAQDDLHLYPLPTHGRVMNSHFPTVPGALPTPAGTPTSSPPLPQKSSPKGTDTPESMMDGRLVAPSVEEAGIGMALGSPSQLPGAWQSPPPMDSTARSWSPDDPSHSNVPARQKSRKWKLLGGLFGGSKKQSPALEPQPFYQLQPELVNHGMETPDYAPLAEPVIHSDKRPGNLTVGSRGRAYSERHSSKSKPDMKRANTMPLTFDSHGPDREQMETPKITLDGGPMNQTEPQHTGLMLNVEIPTVEMERYSVMFGSVLQKPTGASSSSLLARRQATLERLKTVTEALPKHEHDRRGNQRHPMPRRASSPQPAKSPAFSLFPNAPPRLYAAPGPPSPPAPHALHHRRANTSPAVPSPSFPSFPSGAEHETRDTLLAPAPQQVARSPKLKDHISSQMRVATKELKKSSNSMSVKQQKSELATPRGKPRQNIHTATAKVEDGLGLEPLRSNPNTIEPARQIVTSPREPTVSRSIPGSESPLPSLTRGYSVSITASGSTATTSRSASTRHNSPMHSPPPSSLFRNLTTTSAPTRANTIGLSSNPVSGPARAELGGRSREEEEEEREKKLRTAADISIARQISVSREQTRLIIPMRSPSSKRANSPNALTIGQVASPLGVVASGGEHSSASRVSSRKEETKKISKERFAAPVAKPNTPTLVVVGGDSAEEGWEGATARQAGEEEGRPRGVAEHRYRKSERVVFESID